MLASAPMKRNGSIALTVGFVAACNGGSAADRPDAMNVADAVVVADASVGPMRPPGVALCYTPASTSHPATLMFNTALRAGDRNARAGSIDALDAAVQALPNEEQLELLLGLAHLWRLAEPLAGEDAVLSQLADATAARDHLKRAYQLCPTDHRIAAWLGPILVQFGRRLNDMNQVNEGLAVLEQGIAAYPSFVLFSKLLVYADSPRESPEFQNAFDAVFANIGACDQTPNDPACSNATVAHNREGGWLFAADVMTKALKRDDAQAAYERAMTEPGYATWSYQAVVTDRLQNLDARIALYANTNTADDPPAAWTANNQCALCHQQ
jgi:tetratricopeptide (TPR) repeat protein